MQIKMDTDAVRSMSSKFRQTADSMDASLASIKATVEAAGWQSQAREEFILRLEMLRRTSTQSATVLRMMAQAADQKAEQWEAIANIFNGPFYYLEGIWNSVVSFFSGIGNNLWNAITSIKLPSLPAIVLPSISGAAIIGSISSLIPKWPWNPPDWWPFGKKGDVEKSASGGAGGSHGGSWGPDDDTGVIGNGTATTGPTEPVRQSVYDKNNLSDGEYLKTESLDLYPEPGNLGSWNGHCPKYVKKLVPNIENTSGGSAADWIKDYELDPFSSAKDLRTQLEPGDVVVWPKTGKGKKGHLGANNEHGHAAVIIEVHKDHVVLAESSWDFENNGKSPKVDRSLSNVDLSDGLYVWSNPKMGQDKIQVGKE